MGSTKLLSKETVAVVTGASKGIGYETVRALAAGALLFVLAARDQRLGLAATEKLHSEGLKNVVTHSLDIGNPEFVTTFADWIKQTCVSLYILVNNAGMFVPNNIHVNAKQVVRVNYTDTKHLTETLLMKPSAGGARIVIVTGSYGLISTLDNFAKKYLEATKAGTADADGYTNSGTVSKGLINCYARLLAEQLLNRPDRKAEIYVNCADPGACKTDLDPMGTKTSAEGSDTSVWLVLSPPNGSTGRLFHDRKEVSSYHYDD